MFFPEHYRVSRTGMPNFLTVVLRDHFAEQPRPILSLVTKPKKPKLKTTHYRMVLRRQRRMEAIAARMRRQKS